MGLLVIQIDFGTDGDNGGECQRIKSDHSWKKMDWNWTSSQHSYTWTFFWGLGGEKSSPISSSDTNTKYLTDPYLRISNVFKPNGLRYEFLRYGSANCYVSVSELEIWLDFFPPRPKNTGKKHVNFLKSLYPKCLSTKTKLQISWALQKGRTFNTVSSKPITIE